MTCSCGNTNCSCSSPAVVHLADEQGMVHQFYIADTIFILSTEYVLLASANAQDEQFALLKVSYTPEGQRTLQNIDDEQEWHQIKDVLFA